MNTNALINAGGDICTSCGHPFIRNFIGFDTLPLVEFQPRPELTAKKVIDYLKMDPPEEVNGAIKQQKPKKQNRGGDGWQDGEEQSVQF
jgi:hypothetical protein